MEAAIRESNSPAGEELRLPSLNLGCKVAKMNQADDHDAPRGTQPNELRRHCFGREKVQALRHKNAGFWFQFLVAKTGLKQVCVTLYSSAQIVSVCDEDVKRSAKA
jgi:hypothetical protein